MPKFTPDQIGLKMTSGACPEQYDAYIMDRQVGYLRLRHGWFRVDYPTVAAEMIFEGAPIGDGLFEDEEREEWLLKAKVAICDRLNSDEEVANV